MFITNREKKIIIVVIALIVLAVAAYFLLDNDRIIVRWDGCGEDLTYRGESYSTVEIAGMCFFQDNLNTDKYKTGDEIRYIGEPEPEEVEEPEEVDDPFADLTEMERTRFEMLVEEHTERISSEWEREGVSEEELEGEAMRAYIRLIDEWDADKPFEKEVWDQMAEEVFMMLSYEWVEIERLVWEEIVDDPEEEEVREEEEEGEWRSATEGAYTYYDFDPEMGEAYGKLYNFYAVDDERGLCPEGWRVPSDEDWMEVEAYLGIGEDELEDTDERGSDERVGQKMKSERVWDHFLDEGVGESGFDALPGGFRSGNEQFIGLGMHTIFWSSSEGGTVRGRETVWQRSLIERRAGVYRNRGAKIYGAYVRCVTDLK